jgi:hypothetical protein
MDRLLGRAAHERAGLNVPGVASIACAGAPRDLGVDQARACADAIRADLGALRLGERGGLRRWLRARPAGFDASLARDLERHFPHLDERVAGLAGALDVAREDCIALVADELARQVAGTASAAGTTHALALHLEHAPPPTGLVARTTHPDGGYANLTLTRPGLPCALAGVNEHGLAGVVELRGLARTGERCRAPGLLLLDQCIERLDSVEKALEWCERRPAGGRALLVFADAGGALGAIEIDGEGRRRVAAPLDAGTRAGPSIRVDAAARAVEIAGGGVPAARFALPSAL